MRKLLAILALALAAIFASAPAAQANSTSTWGSTTRCSDGVYLRGDLWLDQPIGYVAMLATTRIAPYPTGGLCDPYQIWSGVGDRQIVHLSRFIYPVGWVDCGTQEYDSRGSFQEQFAPPGGLNGYCYTYGWPNGLTKAEVIYSAWPFGHEIDLGLTLTA